MNIDSKTNKKSNKWKIFLVDDEDDILQTFKQGLEQDGHFEVDAYSDPREALPITKSTMTDRIGSDYDLFLIDVKMPILSGFELYQEIKSVIGDNPPVCFITAYETYYDTLSRSFPNIDIGCFISKPIDILDLIAKVTKEISLLELYK